MEYFSWMRVQATEQGQNQLKLKAWREKESLASRGGVSGNQSNPPTVI
jgi:hypothetical protein